MESVFACATSEACLPACWGCEEDSDRFLLDRLFFLGLLFVIFLFSFESDIVFRSQDVPVIEQRVAKAAWLWSIVLIRYRRLWFANQLESDSLATSARQFFEHDASSQRAQAAGLKATPRDGWCLFL